MLSVIKHLKSVETMPLEFTSIVDKIPVEYTTGNIHVMFSLCFGEG